MRAIPKHCLHRGSNRGVVRLNGKDHYTGTWGTPEAEAEYKRLIGEWLVCGGSGSVHEMTVGDLLARYWTHAEQKYRKHGRKTQQLARIRSAFKPVYASYVHVPVKQFGPLALEVVRERMIGLEWTRGYINSAIGCVKRAFKWGARMQLIPGEAFAALDALEGLRRGASDAKETRRIKPAPMDAVKATLPELLPTVATMVQVQHLAAMRPREACLMRAIDINRDGVDHLGMTHPGVWCYIPHQHKTEHHDQERVIFLGPKAQALLLPYLNREPLDYLFSPAIAVESWLKRAGRKLTRRASRAPSDHYVTSSYCHAVRKAAARAKVPAWSPGRLRHARATELRSRFGVEVTAICLGHRLGGVTGVYAQSDLGKASAAMRELG